MGQIQGAARREEGYLFGKRHPELEWAWIILVFIVRYCLGYPLAGKNARKTDATFWRDGTGPLYPKQYPPGRWSYLAFYKKGLIRFGIFPLFTVGMFYGIVWHPYGTKVTVYSLGAILALFGVMKAYRYWQDRRFRRVYLRPLAASLAPVIGIPPHYPTRKWIEATPAMKAVLPHIRVRKPGQCEMALRLWYGTHIEPVLMFLPERAIRAWWWLTGHLPKVTLAWRYGRPEEVSE